MDLLLLAIDPRGRTWFGPRLSYTLPVAELIDLAQAGRIELRDGRVVVLDAANAREAPADFLLGKLGQYSGSTVFDWVAQRGPRRIDPYLTNASGQGVVRIVTVAPGRKVLEVTDAEPIKAMTRRLVAVLDDPAPELKDISFVVLADAAGIARPHLRGWGHRRHRACLSAMREATGGDMSTEILRAGITAISKLSRRASRLGSADPRTIDQQIGMTPNARQAAIWFRF